MTNPQAEQPAEASDAPEKRIRRGCIMIIPLLLIGVGINFLEYRLNVVTIVGGALLIFAIIGLVLISREGKK
ncbi:MAG: hypothetical protein SH847_23210 [Roseiflexaceae bacterium]|nr:hypothetical protein [Roseiflexaceae bacterium]